MAYRQPFGTGDEQPLLSTLPTLHVSAVCPRRNSLTCSECPEYQRHQYYKQYEDHSSFAVADIGITLAMCSFQKPPLDLAATVPLIGKPNFKWAGPFSGTCYLEKSGEDHCELPEGCEETTLQIQVSCNTAVIWCAGGSADQRCIL